MVHKECQIDAFHWVWLSRNEGDLYPLEMVYEPARMLVVLTVSLCSFLIALFPVQRCSGL